MPSLLGLSVMEPSTAEPSLDDLRREFPGWEFWYGISQLWYARRLNTSPPVLLRGEDLMDLRDVVRGWIGRH